jgi:hypothetical protein
MSGSSMPSVRSMKNQIPTSRSSPPKTIAATLGPRSRRDRGGDHGGSRQSLGVAGGGVAWSVAPWIVAPCAVACAAASGGEAGAGGGSPTGVAPAGAESTFGSGGGTVACGCVSSVGWVIRLGTSLARPS